MTYIPDTRNKFKPQLYKGTKGASAEPELNPYYEGNLNDEDKTFVKGFDYAVEDIEDTFKTIDDYLEIEDFQLTSEEIEFISADNELENYTDEELEPYRDNAILIKLIKDIVLRTLECTRDEIITSMIDEYDEDDIR